MMREFVYYISHDGVQSEQTTREHSHLYPDHGQLSALKISIDVSFTDTRLFSFKADATSTTLPSFA